MEQASYPVRRQMSAQILARRAADERLIEAIFGDQIPGRDGALQSSAVRDAAGVVADPQPRTEAL